MKSARSRANPKSRFPCKRGPASWCCVKRLLVHGNKTGKARHARAVQCMNQILAHPTHWLTCAQVAFRRRASISNPFTSEDRRSIPAVYDIFATTDRHGSVRRGRPLRRAPEGPSGWPYVRRPLTHGADDRRAAGAAPKRVPVPAARPRKTRDWLCGLGAFGDAPTAGSRRRRTSWCPPQYPASPGGSSRCTGRTRLRMFGRRGSRP